MSYASRESELADQRERMSALYAKRLADGVCTKCGDILPLFGKSTRCPRCKRRTAVTERAYQDRSRDRRNSKRRELERIVRRTAAGDALRARGRAFDAKRKRLGKCRKCKRTATDGTLCATHRAKESEYQRRYRAKRLARVDAATG